jgi:hypothetical protein
MSQKFVTCPSGIRGIIVWKMIANISLSDSAKQCIRERMKNDVCVAVARKTEVMINLNTTQNQWTI